MPGGGDIFDEIERNNAAAMNEHMRSVKNKVPNLTAKYYGCIRSNRLTS
jgi:hypothetical protein